MTQTMTWNEFYDRFRIIAVGDYQQRAFFTPIDTFYYEPMLEPERYYEIFDMTTDDPEPILKLPGTVTSKKAMEKIQVTLKKKLNIIILNDK